MILTVVDNCVRGVDHTLAVQIVGIFIQATSCFSGCGCGVNNLYVFVIMYPVTEQNYIP